MSIKGLKEALAKKQAQNQPQKQDTNGEVKITPTAPVRIGGNRPQKKAAGRGR